MKGPAAPYLSGIVYELGTPRGISNMLREGEAAETIERLAGRGLRQYSEFEELLGDAIRRCCLATLEQSALAAEDVDAVLLVTESFTDILEASGGKNQTGFRSIRDHVFHLFTTLGITKAAFLCSTYGGSSNFLQAAFIARPLVASGQVRNLLVVCADRHPAGVSRFMDRAVAVAGDGVATCLVRSELPPGQAAFEIEYVGITPYTSSEEDNFDWISDPEPSGRSEDTERRDRMWRARLIEMYRATKYAAADCYDSTGRQPVGFDWLVLNNYNDYTSDLFSRLLGFRGDDAYIGNLARTGHIPACDSLVNLADLSAQEDLRGDAPLLLYVHGPVSCGAISLIKRVRAASAGPRVTSTPHEQKQQEASTM